MTLQNNLTYCFVCFSVWKSVNETDIWFNLKLILYNIFLGLPKHSTSATKDMDYT